MTIIMIMMMTVSLGLSTAFDTIDLSISYSVASAPTSESLTLSVYSSDILVFQKDLVS